MHFPSFTFWTFFLIVAVVYWRLGHLGRGRWLLLANYIFYGWWDPRFLLLLGSATFITYFCALRIGGRNRSESLKVRRWWFAFGLAWLFGALVYFKYVGWFAASFASLIRLFGLGSPDWVIQVALPVGISFFTFQLFIYLVDVYRGHSEATEDPLHFALFVSFFPQLVAGPIERQARLQPQLEDPGIRFTEEHFREGLYHVLYGLFLKVVVADNLAVIANHVFDSQSGERSFPEVLIGVYAFAFQLYGDFAGYSSIARGVAKWLGIDLMVNFRNPYLAENPSDFWRRWHISLSTMLRDYLYIPLGGNRKGRTRTYVNLLLTMVIGGIWHGAAWTFVAWGIFHGAWLCASVWVRKLIGVEKVETGRRSGGWRKVLRILICFHMVCISYVFFRAETLDQAISMLASIGKGWEWSQFSAFGLAFVAFFSLPLMTYEAWLERRQDLLAITTVAWPLRAAFYCAIIAFLLFFPPASQNEFVYFRF